MFTTSRFARSSFLVLLTTTLTTAAYAGHSGSNGSSHFSAPVHSDARILITGSGNKILSKGAAAHDGFVHRNIVRDHRWDPSTRPPGSYIGCHDGCEGEGGLDPYSRPAPQQPGGYKPRDGTVIDHRDGGAGQVTDHRY